MGNLTKDPESRTLSGGATVVTKFSVAVSRSFKGQDGTPKEEVSFIDVEAWGKQAELISKHFTKGKPIIVDGRLKQDQWETQTGEKRSKHVVVLEQFHFVGSRTDAEGGMAPSSSSFAGSSNYASAPRTTQRFAEAEVASHPTSSFQDLPDDDMPF